MRRYSVVIQTNENPEYAMILAGLALELKNYEVSAALYMPSENPASPLLDRYGVQRCALSNVPNCDVLFRLFPYRSYPTPPEGPRLIDLEFTEGWTNCASVDDVLILGHMAVLQPNKGVELPVYSSLLTQIREIETNKVAIFLGFDQEEYSVPLATEIYNTEGVVPTVVRLPDGVIFWTPLLSADIVITSLGLASYVTSALGIPTAIVTKNTLEKNFVQSLLASGVREFSTAGNFVDNTMAEIWAEAKTLLQSDVRKALMNLKTSILRVNAGFSPYIERFVLNYIRSGSHV